MTSPIEAQIAELREQAEYRLKQARACIRRGDWRGAALATHARLLEAKRHQEAR